jgi:hypothetical protein
MKKNKNFLKIGSKHRAVLKVLQQSTRVDKVWRIIQGKLRLEAPLWNTEDRAILKSVNISNWLIRTSIVQQFFIYSNVSIKNDFYETTFNGKVKGIKWLFLITIVSLLAFTIKYYLKWLLVLFIYQECREEDN